MDNYLIFSFVRDPFTRVLSSYHEASPGYSFEGLLSEGVSSGKLNVHFRSQTAQLLSITTSTGRRIRLDFVGRLEARRFVVEEPPSVPATQLALIAYFIHMRSH